MATSADPDFRAHLRALGDKYAASLPERLQAVADGVAAAGVEPDAVALENLHHALHTIAGSAGSFGFALLGEQARELEQSVRGLLAGEQGWSALRSRIEAYLAWARIDPRSTTFPSHD